MRFVKSHPKKGMEISEFTVQRLYRLWQEFQQNDVETADPIRSFVARYHKKFGFDDKYVCKFFSSAITIDWLY